MKSLRSLTALAAALLVLVSPLAAMAGDVIDGNTPANGKPSSGDLGAIWDGSSHRILRGDAYGALATFNNNPAGMQTAIAPMFSSTITASSTINTGPVPMSQAAYYGRKYLRIVQTNYATGAAGLNGGCVYRVLGSYDSITYFPIVYRTLATADSIGTIGRMDTLQFKVWTNDAAPNASGFLYPLNDPNTGKDLPFPWIRIGVLNRGSATVTATLEVHAVPEAN